MKINKYAAVLLAIASTFGVSANAQLQSVEFSPESGVITADGTLGDEKTAFLTAVKNGSGSFNENIVYQRAITDSEDGAYQHKFRLSADSFGGSDDEYKIIVKESVDGSVSEYAFALADKSTIEAFKTAEDKADFMQKNRYRLGLYVDGIEAMPNNNAILSMMTQEDYGKNADELYEVMQRYMLYDYIQKGDTDNLFKYRHRLKLDTFESMKNVFTTDSFSEINEKDATARLAVKSFKNAAEFEKELNEACVLAVVKNSSGYGNVENALKYFANEIGIDANKGSQKIYTMLQNRDFASYSALKDEFNRLVDESNTTKPSGGGGGGGGGGGISMIPTMPGQTSKPEAVADENVNKFVDMTGFEWANEAVDYLRDKNIVSGKEPGKFYPGDSITRSEFVKIIVSAFNIKDGTEDLMFRDVDESRWDYKYINAAYSAGIIEGYSDEYFGCNVPISRQDIAVIMNRIKNFEGGELAQRFVDDREIAEYAYSSVYDLRFKGIINGDEYNCFNPTDNATRAETALIVYSVIK